MSRRFPVTVLSEDRIEADRQSDAARQEQHYDTASSINDLTVDAYRIVSLRRVVADRNVWDSTIPTAEMGLLNEQVGDGLIFAPQTTVAGRLVRVARIVRIGKRGRK